MAQIVFMKLLRHLDYHEDEVIINVQGDEPFIETDVVKAIYTLTNKNKHDHTDYDELLL